MPEGLECRNVGLHAYQVWPGFFCCNLCVYLCAQTLTRKAYTRQGIHANPDPQGIQTLTRKAYTADRGRGVGCDEARSRV